MVTVGVLIFLAGIFTMALSMVLAPRTDRKQNLKVCKTRVRGRLVGYEKKRRSNEGQNYDVYAPKYEIFINGHYEIRTLDDFSRSLDFTGEIELLANPDGYEIMPADGKISRSGKRNIILVLVILVVIMIVAMPFLVKRVFWNGGFI